MPVVLAIMIGLFLGNLLFDSYDTKTVMASKYNIYILQYGVYTNMEVLNTNVKKIENYVIINDQDKYYVYVGFFTNYENAINASKILEDEGIYTFIKTDYFNDEELLKKISNVDQKIMLTKKTSEIKKLINEGVEIYKNLN